MHMSLDVMATYFLTLKASNGRFNARATQYPFIRNRMVKKAWTAASGRI